jgi:hypothetical protein
VRSGFLLTWRVGHPFSPTLQTELVSEQKQFPLAFRDCRARAADRDDMDHHPIREPTESQDFHSIFGQTAKTFGKLML